MSGRDVVLVGCGRLGSAILEGWLTTGAVPAEKLIVLTPSPKPTAERALAAGARINPPLQALNAAGVVVLAVKPAKWREALDPLKAHLSADGVLLSVMAGVRSADLAAAAPGWSVVRLMPTTAVAQAQGVAALWAADATARRTAEALFNPIAELVTLETETQLDVATAVAGSAPAFIHAFVQALARTGASEGLSEEAATVLARGALRSAAAGIETGQTLDALIARIASPGGTTRAGLDALTAAGLEEVAKAAVTAATQRARDLG